MVGIFIDHDIVGIPEPVVTVAKIIRRNRKIETAEPEAARTSSCQVKHMPFAEAARKSPVLKRVIEMVVRVILPGIMANPFVALGMDVRSVGVALRVTKGTSLFRSGAGLLLGRRGACSR